jgi:hypothetical protein
MMLAIPVKMFLMSLIKRFKIYFLFIYLNCKLYRTHKMKSKYISVEGVDWIQLAEDRDRRQAVTNTKMNLRVP